MSLYYRHLFAAGGSRPARAVFFWLLALAGMVMAMAVIGAVTRLTESGLSIMEWRPATGFLPPWTDEEWNRLFRLYQETGQYRFQNSGMTLDEFRLIYWWEYIHRLWGRLIGLVFLVPFVFFLWRRWLTRRLVFRLGFAFALGGLQGALGWYMVASGFSDRVEVSQYRLTLHLGLAVLVLGYLLWTALDVLAGQLATRDRDAVTEAASGLFQPLTRSPDFRPGTSGLCKAGCAVLLALLFLVILSGAIVAGTNAGMIYNSFPLMGGALIPADYTQTASWLVNGFESLPAAQFHHRWFAILVGAGLLGLAGAILRARLAARRDLAKAEPGQQGSDAVMILAGLLALLVLLQIGLGIATLLSVVWIPLAVAHQFTGLMLFSTLVCLCHSLWRESARLK